MSQRDLVAELRGVQLAAPVQLRERVRMIAAAAEPARERRFLRRRSLVLLVPVAAALAGAIVLTRPGNHNRNQELALQSPPAATATHGSFAGATPRAIPAQSGAVRKAFAPAPSPTRAQRYGAWIGVSVGSASAVSEAVQKALRITTALGGYSTSVHDVSAGKTGGADLVVRVPRSHIHEAITRLSQLGTITSEQVEIQDLQAGLNATGRRIARLQRQLATLRAEPETPQRDRTIAAVTAQVQRLQRSEAATRRSAQFATVHLHVATPAPKAAVHHGHGPLHGIGVAAYWTGIGAVYALAFGLPLLLLVGLVYLAVRALRRRRVDALLSRP
jgi:hypothetical protein